MCSSDLEGVQPKVRLEGVGLKVAKHLGQAAAQVGVGRYEAGEAPVEVAGPDQRKH